MGRSKGSRIDTAVAHLMAAKAAIAKRDWRTAVIEMSSATDGAARLLNALEDEHGFDGEALHLERKRKGQAA